MYRTPLIAKRYNRREGIDFNEVFSLVMKHTSKLAMFTLLDLEIEQLNVKLLFTCELEKTIYIDQLRDLLLKVKKIMFPS